MSLSSEYPKDYQFIYSDFDQFLTEVIDFENTLEEFQQENPEYDITSGMSLDNEVKDIQLYVFDVWIKKR